MMLENYEYDYIIMTILFVSFPTMNSTSGLSSSLSMIRTANNSKSSFHEKMQIEYKWISNFFSITCHHMKNLHLFAMAVLCLTCCGCCFSNKAQDFCNRCYSYKTTQIIARNGRLSQDGTTFTVYSHKLIDPDPYKHLADYIKYETTHVYSMTSPEPNGKLCQFTLVPSINTKRLNVNTFGLPENINFRYSKTLDYSRLTLPVLTLPHYSRKCAISIHPDDAIYFSKPFIIYCKDDYILAIPYKMENNICHFYIPKEDLVTENICTETSNLGNIVLKIVLMPPAVVLDVITSPIQLTILVHDVLKGKSKNKIYPYP